MIIEMYLIFARTVLKHNKQIFHLIFNIKNLNVSSKKRKRRKNTLNANSRISIYLK